jgi:hypothetical protein
MYGTPGERALGARERAASRECLGRMKLVIGRSDGDHVAVLFYARHPSYSGAR